jgi:4-amino-4-deoxychorismate lyase
VMVAVSPPVDDRPRAALRVRTALYQRELPHLKHAATLGLTYHRRQAQGAGYDDVLFLGPDGTVSEGSIWNVVFWSGGRVVWPDAPMLAGITMQVLRRELDAVGVPQESRRLTAADLPGLRAAAAVNSHCPAQPLASVDGAVFGDGAELTAVLWQAWRAAAWDEI